MVLLAWGESDRISVGVMYMLYNSYVVPEEP
jgi:hypothetical protein